MENSIIWRKKNIGKTILLLKCTGIYITKVNHYQVYHSSLQVYINSLSSVYINSVSSI